MRMRSRHDLSRVCVCVCVCMCSVMFTDMEWLSARHVPWPCCITCGWHEKVVCSMYFHCRAMNLVLTWPDLHSSCLPYPHRLLEYEGYAAAADGVEESLSQPYLQVRHCGQDVATVASRTSLCVLLVSAALVWRGDVHPPDTYTCSWVATHVHPMWTGTASGV